MDDFVKAASTSSWWIGVVVVGIVLNLISAYAKSPLDWLLNAMSSSWRARTDKARQAHEERVAKLAGNTSLQLFTLAEESRWRFRMIALLLLSVLGLSAAQGIHLEQSPDFPDFLRVPSVPRMAGVIGGILVAYIAMALSFRCQFRATECMRAVADAKRRDGSG
jgi:hypothetical protein